ncbi:alpha/beta fold hydrolase [Bacillus cereus group sp. BfR-BA-01380]|uniref:alpha/beta fold hydrolase n=1 Tax=Bacillus cereus group sp. BfR-BA-01380 TaxID=2920324 RepID=UPI001F592EC8|nr:alpha/beta hydrolase [Bacillus cereus group sp. BfR-BA-01380]
MGERILKINKVEICAESFGNPKDPAVLLIMGAMSSLDWWDEDFCLRLADQGRFVIRYDHRDLGRSTTYEPGTSNYTILDMADDAVGVLDAYSIKRAHIVGMSLGGLIGQILALRYPKRIFTLTLIASSVFGTEMEKLPPMDQNILNYHAKSTSIDWSNQEAAISYIAGMWKTLAGSKPYERERVYKLVQREVTRAKQLPSRFNHAMLQGGEDYYDRMGEISIPVLIIHGTEDPALPYEHGLALAKAIPHAELVTLDGSGHEIHSEDWEQTIESIVKLISQ